MSDCQKNVSKPTAKKPIFKPPTFVPPTSTNTVKGGIKSSTTTTTKSDNVMVTKSGIVTNDNSVLSKNKIKPKTDEKSKEKTTKRPDFQTFVSKGKENIVEKTIGSENRSAKKGGKPKKVLSARSLTDAEYDEIFTAAIQRSFTYSSDEKFLSNENSRENSTFFDGPDSSSTTAPGSKGKKKNIIEPKGSIKMVESNKKPLSEENEGHKNDTVESHDESVIMEDSSEDIVSNSDLDTTFDKTVDIFEKKKKKKKSKLSHGEKLRMICEMMSPWGSHASKSHSQSSSLSTQIDSSFQDSEEIISENLNKKVSTTLSNEKLSERQIKSNNSNQIIKPTMVLYENNNNNNNDIVSEENNQIKDSKKGTTSVKNDKNKSLSVKNNEVMKNPKDSTLKKKNLSHKNINDIPKVQCSLKNKYNSNNNNNVQNESVASSSSSDKYSWSEVKKRFYQPLPSKFKNHKESLMWLMKQRDVGTWITCSNSECKKWRYVHSIKDPSDVPEKWFCDMNPDPDSYKCNEGPDVEIPNFDPEYDFDILFNKFTAGSVVWAKMVGYPWWPAMVDDDTDTEAFYWLDDEDSLVPSYYNVVFFDEKVTRAWISTDNIIKYNREFRYSKEFKTKKEGVDYAFKIDKAMIEADKALLLSNKERLKNYSFLSRYNGPIRRPKDVDSSDDEKCGTRKKCRREINEKQSQKHKELNQDGRDDITSDHNEINNNSNKSMTITEKLSSADENCNKISGDNNNSIISNGNESYIGIDDDNNNEINSSDVVVSCKKISTDKSTVNDGSVNKNLDKEEMGSREKIHCNDTNNDKYQDSMESFDEGNNDVTSDVDEIINNDFMNDTAMKIDKCHLLSGTSMAVDDDDNEDFVEVLGNRENQEPISSSVLNNALNDDAPNSQSSTQSFNPLIEDVLINRYDCDDELTDSILSNCFVSEGDAVVPNSCSFIESSLVLEE